MNIDWAKKLKAYMSKLKVEDLIKELPGGIGKDLYQNDKCINKQNKNKNE